MFYEVRVFDGEGQLKKTISGKRLSNSYWRKNENALPDFGDSDSDSDLEGLRIKSDIQKTTLVMAESLD